MNIPADRPSVPPTSGQFVQSSASSGITTPGMIWLAISLIGPLLPWSDYAISYLVFALGYWFAVAVWAAIPALALLFAAKQLTLRRYLSGLGCLILPIAAILLWFCGRDFDNTVSFHLSKSTYDTVVADAKAGRCSAADIRRWERDADIYDANCDTPVIVIVVWERFLSGWHGIVYDAADQIILEPRMRNAAWQATSAGGVLGCSMASRSLGGHYYLASGDLVQRGAGPCE